ncbi:CRISPR-associated helicase Cas3' [Archaeoglobus sp.]|uniref:CRISPR-associated helicase Cas3' n=1 Tax=Archaeoglobus sp. TaxID=1872626 RepID=UPI0025C0EDD1|nr:CRISPR-associated helicase Cas3' [Archaeoglobus sp.]
MRSLKFLPIAKLEINKNGEKYFQTLEGHTVDALKILKIYIKRNREIVDQFCERWKLNKEKFLRNLFLTVYLHDIGKLTKEFQQNIRQNRRSQRYPHAYYGFFLLHDSFTDTIIDVPIELAPILGHHTQLYDNLYSDYNQFEKPTFLEEEIRKFVSDAARIYKELGFDEFFKFDGFTLNDIPKFSWNGIEKARKRFVRKINMYVKENKDWERVKSVFSYIFAILQTCDDYASVGFRKFVENGKEKGGVFGAVLKDEDAGEYVPVLQIDDPVKAVLGDREPYEFQKKVMSSGKFVTLFAPCGRGKTEAALLWALNILKKHKRNKIIFAMPTQTTSNAMYDRFIHDFKFGKENVGLYHGRSFIKLRDELKKEKEEEFDEEKDAEELRSETFKGNIFFKPVTITTVDHLIYSFVKGFSQADFAFGNLQNAVIIFDEVHYYEKYTLEHLLALFKLLRKMDIPHLVMSGTLPEFMLKKLHDYEHVVDWEGLKFQPFKIELDGETIFDSEVLEEIAENYRKGLTQFVILNTVERAKDLYKKLKEKLKESFNQPNIMLYHSQFTYDDRIKKENEIYQRIKQKPFVLVATQVIEISLDISCDVMHSELAPPDALGQRAGRLNRKGKFWKNEVEHKLKIYIPENHLPYDEKLINKSREIIVNYQKPVSYKEIKELCDLAYAEYELGKSDLLIFFKKCAVFGEHWRKVATESEEGLRFKVREENVQYVDVIPECIFEESRDNALRVQNTAKIPLYYLLEDLNSGGGAFYLYETPERKRAFWICRYPYSYEIGFDYGVKTDNLNIL